jgi:hypothetical protein
VRRAGSRPGERDSARGVRLAGARREGVASSSPTRRRGTHQRVASRRNSDASCGEACVRARDRNGSTARRSPRCARARSSISRASTRLPVPRPLSAMRAIERLHMQRPKVTTTRGRFMEVENRGRGLTPSATRSHSRTTFPSISSRLAPRPSRRAPSLAHPAEIPPRRPEQDVPHISGLNLKPQSSTLAPKQRSPPVHGCLSAAHHHGAIASSRAPCGTAVRVTVPPGQRTHTAVGTPDRPST